MKLILKILSLSIVILGFYREFKFEVKIEVKFCDVKLDMFLFFFLDSLICSDYSGFTFISILFSKYIKVYVDGIIDLYMYMF